MDAVVEEVCVKLGYNLKDKQRKVILSFVKGEDVFVVLPTGFGKSLCFACLPLIFDRVREDGLSSIIIIITPLIAIMKDQVSLQVYSWYLFTILTRFVHLRKKA